MQDLITALSTADMLEIDGLHAWHFSLDAELLARHSSGAATDATQPLLSIECMDGRALRKWHFSLAQVLAASFDPALQSWNIAANAGQHQLQCFAAFSGDNAEQPDEAANDDE